MKPVRLEADALEELAGAADWYEQRVAGLGRRFLDSIDRSLSELTEFPRLGAVVEGLPADLEARRLGIVGFPYLLIYMELGREIRILAVAHAHRAPDYWLRRIGE